jgi:hypothetical protein
MAMRKLTTQEMPLKAAFALKGIVKTVNAELMKYDEVKLEALRRLGEKDEKGELIVQGDGTVKLNEENTKQFVDELNQLLNTEISIGSIKLSDLGEKATLTANELSLLDDIIVE